MSAEDIEIEYMKSNSEFLQLGHEDPMENPDCDASDEVEEHWEPNTIRQLLELYIENIEKFRSPKMRKKTVWTEISGLIGKTPDSCDKKFRNLKQTYLRLLKKKHRMGAASIKWPYFEIFEEIFCVDGKYQPEIAEKVKESDGSIAKAFLTVTQPITKFQPIIDDAAETVEKQNAEDIKRRINRKRYAEFRKVTEEMRDRQKTVEAKLDRLIGIVEESNNIQKERNRLFQEYLNKLDYSSQVPNI